MGIQHRGSDAPARPRGASRPTAALDLALLLDATGSMAVHLTELRRQLGALLSELREHVPDLRCGAVAFKDHGPCEPYLTRTLTPTVHLERLARFLGDPSLALGRGGGALGDGAEAVECALRQAGALPWRAHARRAVLLVGDRPPHGAGPGRGRCPHGVDWRQEVERLAALGVALHAVCVGDSLEARRTFEYAAAVTGGTFLPRVHVRDLASAIASVCHREAGDLERYRQRLARAGALTATRRELLAAVAA